MILDVEGKEPIALKSFARVETALRKLWVAGRQSVAILTREDGAFIQVAGGRVTCIVEKRLSSSEPLFRAYYAEARVPFEGPRYLERSTFGKLWCMPDEFLFIDYVVPLFHAFYKQSEEPGLALWREFDYESVGAVHD